MDKDKFIGQCFVFYCLEWLVGQLDGFIFGMDVYLSDMFLCVVVMYVGVMIFVGGIVIVQFNLGVDGYQGLSCNGVMIGDLLVIECSIVFVIGEEFFVDVV